MKKEYSIAIEKLKELRSIICKTNLYVMDSNEKFYTMDDVLFNYIDKWQMQEYLKAVENRYLKEVTNCFKALALSTSMKEFRIHVRKYIDSNIEDAINISNAKLNYFYLSCIIKNKGIFF